MSETLARGGVKNISGGCWERRQGDREEDDDEGEDGSEQVSDDDSWSGEKYGISLRSDWLRDVGESVTDGDDDGVGIVSASVVAPRRRAVEKEGWRLSVLGPPRGTANRTFLSVLDGYITVSPGEKAQGSFREPRRNARFDVDAIASNS